MVQQLRHCASTAGGTNDPWSGEMLHGQKVKKKKKKKKLCHLFGGFMLFACFFFTLIFYREFLELGYFGGLYGEKSPFFEPPSHQNARMPVKGTSPVPGTQSLFSLGLFIHP